MDIYHSYVLFRGQLYFFQRIILLFDTEYSQLLLISVVKIYNHLCTVQLHRGSVCGFSFCITYFSSVDAFGVFGLFG